VRYGGQRVLVNEDLIAEVMSLAIDGIKFFSKRVDKNAEVKKFSKIGEDLLFVMDGIK
ncbi:hypothetical protein KI387_004132, partial [Taxus chinensis]